MAIKICRRIYDLSRPPHNELVKTIEFKSQLYMVFTLPESSTPSDISPEVNVEVKIFYLNINQIRVIFWLVTLVKLGNKLSRLFIPISES